MSIKVRQLVDSAKSRGDFFAKIEDLRKKAFKTKFTGKQDSTQLIREMRDSR